MMGKVKNLVEIARMTLSPAYANTVSNEYWSRQEVSLEELTPEQESTYFQNLYEILDASPDQKVLDYGCGAGEKAAFLAGQGLKVSGADISPSLMEVARSRGVDCQTIDEVKASGERFDVIFMHGVFMYVHPRERQSFLQSLKPLLNSDGRLFLLGEPDIGKRNQGPRNRLQILLAPVLPVYQFFNASFWTKPVRLEALAEACGFIQFEKRDGPPTISAPDRSHFVLRLGA